MKKPPALKKGDTIGIISPAGRIKDLKGLDRVVKFLNNKGFEVELSPNVMAQGDYLAGEDSLRLADVNWAFKTPEVKAIICSRGGYGCARLLDEIDYKLIEKNPKIFLGHSDITCFLNNFPVVTFHSPMAVGDFGKDTVDGGSWSNFSEVLQGVDTPYTYKANSDFFVINSGVVKGLLAGGNLCVLTSLLGTKYFPNLRGKILLLEDLNEPLYKIDRMLNQLKMAGVFENIVGVVVACFSGVDVTKEFLQSFIPKNVPAFYGFDASHEEKKYTLPINVEYMLDADLGELSILENYLC